MNRREADKDRAAGFTLIEMLVVLTIVALVAGISALSLRGMRDNRPPVEFAREIYASLTAARYRAMNAGENQTVEVDVPGKSFAIPFDRRRIRLPPSWTLSVTVGRARLASGDAGKIVFQPDGTSSGADIEFHSPSGGQALVRVNWLTGLVEYSANGNR
ncbi:GspH/FimT family pseudopilin [Pararhizobium gei]|uniref:GspH/FimT family pseudopilin n=1 Tax=Pararhizobium gei TaxID=1395951 RepID=UPI0023DC6D27|nr:GspH/FimT family pseudopilin [Rhizobium gei]